MRFGKSYRLLCERASELELEIDFCKKFNLEYQHETQELEKIYKELEVNKNVCRPGKEKSIFQKEI